MIKPESAGVSMPRSFPNICPATPVIPSLHHHDLKALLQAN
jgi:hypothetical protein